MSLNIPVISWNSRSLDRDKISYLEQFLGGEAMCLIQEIWNALGPRGMKWVYNRRDRIDGDTSIGIPLHWQFQKVHSRNDSMFPRVLLAHRVLWALNVYIRRFSIKSVAALIDWADKIIPVHEKKFLIAGGDFNTSLEK